MGAACCAMSQPTSMLLQGEIPLNFTRPLLGLLLLGLAACAPSAGRASSPATPNARAQARAAGAWVSPALDGLYEAARREGKVVSYFPNAPKFEAAKAAFEQRYPGITVDV